MIDIKSFIEDALQASLNITKELEKNLPYLYEDNFLGAGGDISCGADLMAERIYVSFLSRYAKIISEESGVIGDGKYIVYLDPLDGSDNFKSGFAYYGASIAISLENITIGAIIVNFISKEVFIRTSKLLYKTYLDDFTCKEDIINMKSPSIGIVEKAYNNTNAVTLLNDNGLKFRSPGAVALSLASSFYVKYMLFFGTIRIYDVQAGLFLCKDMYIYKDDDMIIISRYKDVFQILCKLFKKEL